jgi:branched-subunit amino acid transport protein
LGHSVGIELATVLAAAAGTYLMRTLPLLGTWRPAGRMLRLWEHVVPAALAALLAPGLLVAHGRLVAHPWHDPALWALVPTVAVALGTRRLTATVAVGVAAFALARAILA